MEGGGGCEGGTCLDSHGVLDPAGECGDGQRALKGQLHVRGLGNVGEAEALGGELLGGLPSGELPAVGGPVLLLQLRLNNKEGVEEVSSAQLKSGLIEAGDYPRSGQIERGRDYLRIR